MKKILAYVLTIASLFTGVVCYAAEAPKTPLPDNPSISGNEITIKGLSNDANENVAIKVFNSEDDLIYISQTKSDMLKKYVFSFKLNLTENDTLKIVVNDKDSSASTLTFEYEVSNETENPLPPTDQGSDTTPPTGGTVTSDGNNSGSSGGGGSSITKKPVALENKEEAAEQKEQGTATLNDVKGHWSEKDVNVLLEKKIITGDENGNFSPDSSIKRSEFLALAIRAMGVELVEYKGGYSDVKKDDWFSSLVQTAVEYGIISQDSNFRPNDLVKREEMAKMTASVLKIEVNTEADAGNFKDNDSISDWAKPYIEAAFKAELIKGDENGNFNPAQGATKAEAATIIKRLCDRLEEVK